MKLGKEMLEWFEEEDKNIFFTEFLLSRGYFRDLTNYLSGKFESFSAYMKKAEQFQELKLIKWGVLNKLNPAITIFLLKNKHGYRDEYGLRHSAKLLPLDHTDKELDTEINELMKALPEFTGQSSNGQTEEAVAEVIETKPLPNKEKL